MSKRSKRRLWQGIMMAGIAVVFVFTAVMTAFAADETYVGSTVYEMFARTTYPDVADDAFMYPTTINGGVWDYFPSRQASGTGVFDTYLAIGSNKGVERGFNTGRYKFEFPVNDKVADYDEDDAKTRVLPLKYVPIVNMQGTLYREFCVDINEVSGIPSQYLSLEVLQIWTTDNYNLEGKYSMVTYSFADSTTDKVYDLDSDTENNTLILDYGVNTGSGKPDYKLFVPAHLFGDKLYVVMVVVHGVAGATETGYGCSDGFEEWGVRKVERASKSGYKWHDLDADGIWDAGEPGLEGWTIYVDINDNGSFDAGEPYAETDATGYYKISDITAGTYKVREVLQSGWSCSYPAGGYYEETFVGGMDYTGNNFGNYQLVTKSGYKWHDRDADGVWDATEPGLENWKIFVDLNDNGTWEEGEPCDLTDSTGYYEITGIMPSSTAVKVREVLQAGWYRSFPTSGYHEETFLSGGTYDNNNFGNYQLVTKSGYKWHDRDADGVWDATEPGLENWKIFVDLNDNGTWEEGEPCDLTDSTGYYEITGIMPSSTAVKVREVLQAGWYRSFPTSGYHEETFLSGGTYTNNNFGNWTWAKKSGYKFLDDNQNGVFDTEEFGLQGWTIKLWMRDTGGALVEVDSTITDALGYYEFPYIQPGVTYYVSEVIPNTLWTQTCPNSTTQGAIILSDHPELGYVYEINLDSQEHHANNNFGNWYYHDETAWAYDPDYAIEFNEIVGPNNWGWTNGPYTLAELTAGVEMELWAGVGLNDINNKGVQVGTLTARLEGNILTVRYDMFDPNKLTTVQLYIGNTPLPMKKTGKITVPVANPGQFPFKWTGAPAASYEFAIDITSDKYLKTINWSGQLYIAAHADVRMFEEIDG